MNEQVDVATRELLVLDAEDKLSTTRVCLPRMLLPALPLLSLSLCFLSVLITLLLARRTGSAKNFVP